MRVLPSVIGAIAPGCRADLLIADARYNVLETWIGGTRIET